MSVLKSVTIVRRAFASSLYTTSMLRENSVPFLRLIVSCVIVLLLRAEVLVSRLESSILSKMLHSVVLNLVLYELLITALTISFFSLNSSV